MRQVCWELVIDLQAIFFAENESLFIYNSLFQSFRWETEIIKIVLHCFNTTCFVYQLRESSFGHKNVQ